MKISYKVLEKYIPNIKDVKEVAEDLIQRTAEVEEIILEWENLKDIFIWEVLECTKHPDSEKLNICKVRVLWEEKQIVCWAPNVKPGIKVPIAVIWAKLSEDFVIKKTKIRGETSEWMICSLDELWLIKERQTWIMILEEDAPIWINMRDFLWKNDAVLEVDNKAINHRPDLFSHVWIIRELFAIDNDKFDFEYENRDFSSLKDLWIKNNIPELVKRYIWLKVNNVSNIETPDYIKQVLSSAWIDSKGLLIDITNYSLYFYGQPTHIFDADKIEGTITIRLATSWEDFLGLDDKQYKLSDTDIVIADDKKVLALGWVIWWKETSVTENTKNIIIESANFDHSTVRKTWKSLWIRTDSLNVFEKSLLPEMAHSGLSLIVSELEKNLDNISLESISDSYEVKQEEKLIDYDLNFINNLIWREYDESLVISILNNLWIKKEGNSLVVPFWRKDLENKADIAEEITRIDGYENVQSTVPRINLWAITQNNTYKVKRDTRNFFTWKWFFDMYTYSFVGENLIKKTLWDINTLVELKNSLSEESTHMRGWLIPNLLLSLEKNIREFPEMKMFELEKVFSLSWTDISENYELSGVITSKKDVVYYDMQEYVSLYFQNVWINSFYFDEPKQVPSYAHSTRTANIILRWKVVWRVWEIHPKIASNFDINTRIGFFEINVDSITPALYSITKAKDLSTFQENNFDLNFVVDKKVKWKDISSTIEKSNSLITKVDLFDVYESEEKLAWKRSLSFKVFFQSQTETLSDKVKNKLIDEIVKKVEKKGWILR